MHLLYSDMEQDTHTNMIVNEKKVEGWFVFDIFSPAYSYSYSSRVAQYIPDIVNRVHNIPIPPSQINLPICYNATYSRTAWEKSF